MNSGMSANELTLWNEWKEKDDDVALTEIIQKYSYLVDFHVERISSYLPNNVSRDDIKSLGMLGLYDAITKFEAERNLKFETYASFRIKGSIMDGLRKEDWLPRSLREKTKKVERATEELEKELHRSPTAKEISERTGMSEDEVESVVRDALFSNVLSIEEKPKTGQNFNEGIGYIIPDEESPSPEEEVYMKELKKELIAGIKKLNKKEQMVISLFYHDELTLTEIGEILDLTTSRISQIHKKAIFKLKDILAKAVNP